MDFTISNSASRLLIGGLMLTAALGASWMIEPSSSIASMHANSTPMHETLLNLESNQFSIRVVPGLPEPNFELLDQDGALVGRFESLEAVAQSAGMASGHLLAELTLEEPIN